MRIFTILLIIVVIIKSSDAQELDKSVKKPVKIDKNNLAFANDYNTMDIGGSLGITYPYTDISASTKRNFAIAIDLTKFLTHTFALQARLMHASLSGVDIYKPEYGFNTTIHYDISLNGIVQFGNISFLKRNPDLAFYTSFGLGLVHYSPSVYTDGGSVVQKGIYSQYSQPLVEMDYQSTTDLIIPIGIGVKYRLSNNYSITCEFSYRTTNSDKLDGFYKLLSASDKYSFFGAGFTYHIGKKAKVLEWENPLQDVYDDLHYLKKKINLLSKDTDKDGVTDYYDLDPGTPGGVKVYGDGTSVDSDMDGIPDTNDSEPFSEKNAEVDAFGKGINKSVNTVSPIETTEKEIEKKSDSDNKNTDASPAPSVVINPAIPKSDTIRKIDSDNKSLYENYKDVPSVYFASGENKISAKHYKTLDYIAKVMSTNPTINYNIIGICDNTGNLEYNLSLSKRRAESVKRYLEKNYNIGSDRLSISTIGTYEIINGNNQMNRRVDFQVRN